MTITKSTPVGEEEEATLDKTELIFTPENYETPQTVTVTGHSDKLADGDVSFTISLTSSGSYAQDTSSGGYRGLPKTALNFRNKDNGESVPCPNGSYASGASCICQTGSKGDITWNSSGLFWDGSCLEDTELYRTVPLEMHEYNPVITIQSPSDKRDQYYAGLKSWPFETDVFDRCNYTDGSSCSNVSSSWWLKVVSVDSVRAGSSVQPEQFLGGYNGEGKDFKLYYIRPEKYASHDNGALASDNGGWASGSHINEIVAGSNTVLYDAVLEFWYGEPSATTHRVPLGLTWQSDKSCSGETLTTLEEANPIECFHECMGSPAPRRSVNASIGIQANVATIRRWRLKPVVASKHSLSPDTCNRRQHWEDHAHPASATILREQA